MWSRNSVLAEPQVMVFVNTVIVMAGPLENHNLWSPQLRGPDDPKVKQAKATCPLRLPHSVKAEVERRANRDGIRVNQVVATAAAEKLAATDTAAFFAERRGGRFPGVRSPGAPAERRTTRPRGYEHRPPANPTCRAARFPDRRPLSPGARAASRPSSRPPLHAGRPG